VPAPLAVAPIVVTIVAALLVIIAAWLRAPRCLRTVASAGRRPTPVSLRTAASTLGLRRTGKHQQRGSKRQREHVSGYCHHHLLLWRGLRRDFIDGARLVSHDSPYFQLVSDLTPSSAKSSVTFYLNCTGASMTAAGDRRCFVRRLFQREAARGPSRRCCIVAIRPQDTADRGESQRAVGITNCPHSRMLGR
jgi:hypothetical protein